MDAHLRPKQIAVTTIEAYSAAVGHSLDYPDRWAFVLSANNAFFKDDHDTERQEFNFDNSYGFTIVHELAHLITLDKEDQRKSFNTTKEDCKDGWFNGNDCYFPDAIIRDFYNKFYTDPKILEQHPYVSYYASTNIREDIAECFAWYTTQNGQGNLPAKDGEYKDYAVLQKIYFMENYPELKTLADKIYPILKPDFNYLSNFPLGYQGPDGEKQGRLQTKSNVSIPLNCEENFEALEVIIHEED